MHAFFRSVSVYAIVDYFVGQRKSQFGMPGNISVLILSSGTIEFDVNVSLGRVFWVLRQAYQDVLKGFFLRTSLQ